MYARLLTIEVTTDGDGDAEVDSGATVNGQIFTIRYVKKDFADGVYFTVYTETTGQTLWAEAKANASKLVNPRQVLQNTVGEDLYFSAPCLYYEDGAAKIHGPIVAVDERIKILVGGGGANKSGTFQIIFG